MATVACSACGLVLAVEGQPQPLDDRPCPKCGGTHRNYAVTAETGHIAITGFAATAVVKRYPDLLLEEAADLISRGKFGIAVVVAHMACEVAVERALTAAFVKRQIIDLEEAVSDFLNGYNLASDRLCNLYIALTADAIRQQPFWGGFAASAKRRNNIIHGGAQATDSEARESQAATTRFVEHVMKQIG